MNTNFDNPLHTNNKIINNIYINNLRESQKPNNQQQEQHHNQNTKNKNITANNIIITYFNIPIINIKDKINIYQILYRKRKEEITSRILIFGSNNKYTFDVHSSIEGFSSHPQIYCFLAIFLELSIMFSFSACFIIR